MNNIFKFQDIWRVLKRVRTCTERHADRQTDIQIECIIFFQLWWKVLKIVISGSFIQSKIFNIKSSFLGHFLKGINEGTFSTDSFSTFSNKVEMHSIYAIGLSVCLSVHALTLVNILQISWNVYTLFIPDVALTLLVYMGLRVRLHRRTIFLYIIQSVDTWYKQFDTL